MLQRTILVKIACFSIARKMKEQELARLFLHSCWHMKEKTNRCATHRLFFFAFELILPGLDAVREAEYCHKGIAEQLQMKTV